MGFSLLRTKLPVLFPVKQAGYCQGNQGGGEKVRAVTGTRPCEARKVTVQTFHFTLSTFRSQHRALNKTGSDNMLMTPVLRMGYRVLTL